MKEQEELRVEDSGPVAQAVTWCRTLDWSVSRNIRLRIDGWPRSCRLWIGCWTVGQLAMSGSRGQSCRKWSSLGESHRSLSERISGQFWRGFPLILQLDRPVLGCGLRGAIRGPFVSIKAQRR